MKLYKLFHRPPFFLSASHWITKRDSPIKGSPRSRKAVIIPLVLIQYGSLKQKLKSFRHIRPALFTSVIEMRKSASGLKKNPHHGKKKIDKPTLHELENYAFGLGISKIGYTRVNPDYIFDKFEILYDKAMVLLMEMDRKAIKSSPSEAATSEIWKTYSDLGVTVNKIAGFLRQKGFNCHPSPAIGGDVCTVPVAESSGLGAVGKNGLLITPEFGPSHRIAVVFIDADNLPLKSIEDNKHLWIKDFCETCNHCVKTCPGNAIYKQTKILEDGYPQYIEREKCALPFSQNCCTCIKSCPFIHGNYEKIKIKSEELKVKS